MTNLIKKSFENEGVADEDVEIAVEAIEEQEGDLVSREKVSEYIQEQGYSREEAGFLIINSVGKEGIRRKEVMHEPNRYDVEPGSYLTRVSV